MESLGRVAGGVAHDFNNLLMVIGGFADLARAALDSDPEAARSHLDRVISASGRAAALTRQLLLFARSQRGEPVPVDLAGACRDVAKTLEGRLASGTNLHLALPAEGPVVEADPGQIQQVLMNLLLNAADAVAEGGTIRLLLTRLPGVDDLGERALLVVSDDGCGMPEEIRGQALEPFFTTKGEHGTGLGLATVYGVVTGLGGQLDLLSAPGSGTSVVVELPASDALSVPDVEEPELRLGSGQRILVVEDDPVLCDLVARVLGAAGYEVTTAQDGLVAAEVAERAEHLDALVVDLRLPGCSGIEVVAAARGPRPWLPVVLMSGSDVAREVAREVGLGGPTVSVQKPVYPARLLEAVATSLEAARAPAPPPTPPQAPQAPPPALLVSTSAR
jgi:CheY-like chemotaxis protein